MFIHPKEPDDWVWEISYGLVFLLILAAAVWDFLTSAN